MNLSKLKRPSIFKFLGLSLATSYLAISTAPANAQLFTGAQNSANQVFNGAGGGVNLAPVVVIFFGAISLALFVAGVWKGIEAYKEFTQGGSDGNWAPILYSFISFALLIMFITFAQRILFGG